MGSSTTITTMNKSGRTTQTNPRELTMRRRLMLHFCVQQPRPSPPFLNNTPPASSMPHPVGRHPDMQPSTRAVLQPPPPSAADAFDNTTLPSPRCPFTTPPTFLSCSDRKIRLRLLMAIARAPRNYTTTPAPPPSTPFTTPTLPPS